MGREIDPRRLRTHNREKGFGIPKELCGPLKKWVLHSFRYPPCSLGMPLTPAEKRAHCMSLTAIRFRPEQGHRVIRCVVLHDDRQSQTAEAELRVVHAAQTEVLVIYRVVIVPINNATEARLSLSVHA